MKRFKDSQKAHKLVVSQDKFLKFPFPPLFWDTKKPPSLGRGEYQGLIFPKVPIDFVKKYQDIRKVIDMQPGKDEKVAGFLQLGLNALNVTNMLINSATQFSSFAPELSYFMFGSLAAGLMNQVWLNLGKAPMRRLLIALYPHTIDALKKFNTKTYKIKVYDGNKYDEIDMTIEEIADSMKNADLDRKSGAVWIDKTTKFQYAFKSIKDVNEINHMFKHHLNSEIRDTFLSYATLGTYLTTAVALNTMVNDGQKKIEEFKKKATDIPKEAPASSTPPQNRSQPTQVFNPNTGKFETNR